MSNDSKRRRVGSVRRQPSGRYLARITVGCRADGSPRTVSRTCDTEQQAESWILTKSVELGERPETDAGITLSVWWDAYRHTKGARLSKGTLRTYTSNMNTVWLKELGDVQLEEITAPRIQSVLLSLTRSKATHCRATLSAVLTAAVNNNPQMLRENPMRGTRFELPHDTGSAYENEAVWDDDPFAAIEGTRELWDAQTVVRAFPLMHGLRLEPVWLAMVGAGLRMQEAFALRPMDVRRAQIATDDDGSPIMATQLAIHHAESIEDGRKRTKTRRSVRIVTMLEPFGGRYHELACAVSDRTASVCDAPRSNAVRMWRGYFATTSTATAKHRPKSVEHRGDRGRLAELPYLALSKMRRSHESMMQQAKVLDSINSSMHGHSQQVAYKHYQMADETEAVLQAQRSLKLVI